MVGQQGVFSLTGSFCGRPITIKVLPRINLHLSLFFLISSKMNKVDLALESISFNESTISSFLIKKIFLLYT